MKGYIYKPKCKCKGKKCSCKARWGFLIDVGINPKTGRRKQKFKGGFDTRKKAEAEAAQLLSKLELSGGIIDESNITFEDFADDWLGMYQSTGRVKISTVRVRKHEISRLLDYFAKLKLKDITRKRYQDALNDLKKRGYADNTLDGAHRTGRMIFKKAMEMELLKKDPTQYVHLPRTQKTVEELKQEDEIVKYLEKEELALFLQTAKKHGLERDEVIFTVLSYTGIRAGELCALKWRNIDFNNKTISVTKTLYNPSNNIKGYTLLPPKTKSSKRTIDIDDRVLEALQKHRNKQNEIRMRYRDTYHDKDFVFAQMDEVNPGYPL